MKNITLSVDEKTLMAARRYAVERDTTVNALVRAYLTQLVKQTDRVRSARRKLRELSNKSEAGLGKVDWKRESLHER